MAKRVTHSPYLALAIFLLGAVIFPAKSFPVYAGPNVCPAGDVKYEVDGGYTGDSDGSGWVEVIFADEDDQGTARWGANEGCTITGVCIKYGNETIHLNAEEIARGSWEAPDDPGNGISHVVLSTNCGSELYCGDGEVTEPEECDYGEGVNGQVCTPNYGERCQYCSDICELKTVEGPYCGDEEINGPEDCDEGDSNGQACTPGYGKECEYCSETCTPETVTGPYCGDGNIDRPEEECDDGNDDNGDGCSAECKIECIEGPTWASGVVDYVQGTLKNGNPITDPIRTDPSKTLGPNDTNFYSLGKNGWIILNFVPFVVDVDGPDLSFHEITWGSRSSYPEEKISVEVSQDGINWHLIGEASSRSGSGGVAYLDFSPTSLLWIQYVRLTDTTNYGPHASNADGYDLDAVDATYGVCEEPQPKPVCGNGIKEEGEECDGENSAPEGYYCTELCTLEKEKEEVSGVIHGCKFNDLNENGIWDDDESTLPGWTINLGGEDLETVPTTTGDDGCYEFAELPDGEYTVSEVLEEGWQQTYPTGEGSHTITIVEGESHEANFGNYLIPPTPSREPDLEVEKEVSTETTEVNTIVTYTIIVSNTGETVLDITVTDIPPAGFTYVAGSALVDGVPNEPTLSGGSLIWELKDVDPGTDVTITYQMDVGGTASEDALENTVFAAAGEIKKWDPAEVLVTEEEKTSEGEVLGARSEPEVLAETGAAPARLLAIWAVAAMMFGLGLLLRVYAQALAKKSAS